jgi:hypothetical protein
VPYEKIFIARSSKCSGSEKHIYNQYWFVTDKNTLEYEEIFPVNNISYKVFILYEYESKSDKQSENEFTKSVKEFINELKNNPKTEGYIVHSSKNKRMKRNIEKIKSFVKKEGVNLGQIKTVIRTRLEPDRNGQLIPSKDKNAFPALAIIEIKK